MNDAEAFKAAYEHADLPTFDAGWKAALQWRDSQVGEPVKCIRCGGLTHHIGNVCYGCNNALAAANGGSNATD